MCCGAVAAVAWCCGCGSVVAITAVAGALYSKATPLLRLTLNLAACLARATFGGTSVKLMQASKCTFICIILNLVEEIENFFCFDLLKGVEDETYR